MDYKDEYAAVVDKYMALVIKYSDAADKYVQLQDAHLDLIRIYNTVQEQLRRTERGNRA